LLLVLFFISLLNSSAVNAQQRPSADEILAAAKADAAAQHKDIFLVFGASWCPPCRELDSFMADREIRPILEKYFVLAHLSVFEQRGKHPELNNPGGEKLVADLGGEAGGVPFLVFLDAQGRPLINSLRPVKGKAKGENVGYPALPEEIDWFMNMLRQTLPSLTAPDARSIETWLRKHSSN
jgi:thioredoxin-related protein